MIIRYATGGEPGSNPQLPELLRAAVIRLRTDIARGRHRDIPLHDRDLGIEYQSGRIDHHPFAPFRGYRRQGPAVA